MGLGERMCHGVHVEIKEQLSFHPDYQVYTEILFTL